ncbi:MSHA biogenesis protein MshK [Vibrio sp. S4M6]|uniref:MSHA biogenesis protein MshK n=1 Tax=Vibrio sinus TaxID=2946865 RepID=UPI002029FE50|nr:MSHA biogenesis protein MshK [Vibrio sinus]MCL9780523.1 MSHA biogenesis protein MshK [Vibrio sinus]
MAKWTLGLVFLSLSATVWGAKDPTAPLGWTAPKPSGKQAQQKAKQLPKLQGILCQERGKCYATLNNTIVRANDVIGQYRVKNIGQDSVTLVSQGKQWKLKLFPLNIKD